MVKERIDPYRETNFLVKSYGIRRYRLAKGFISKNKRRLILDVGCGTGFGMVILKNSSEIIGIDCSVDAVQYGRENYGHEKANFLVADAHHLPFRDSLFDCVLCLEVIEHVKSPDIVISEVRRVLRPKGSLVLSTPNAKTPTGNPFHLKEFSYQELLDFIEQFGFEISFSRGILVRYGWMVYAIFDKLLHSFCSRLCQKSARILLGWLSEFLVRISFFSPARSFLYFWWRIK